MSLARRWLSSARPLRHENPLGLPRSNAPPPPTIPRRGIPQKRGIPHVRKVLLVASGKGGVGKSTVAVNLAMALALRDTSRPRLRVGLLDLDIFGPSIPKLMGLADANNEPELTPLGALIPLRNHGIPCMSMGFLLPPPPPAPASTTSTSTFTTSNADTPVVWRGLMVQKAVQQLLFDVDWRDPPPTQHDHGEGAGAGLDVLVVDMPPGTGDVPLTVGQLVNVDGAVIVSTPQDVALSDVRKGVAMFRKVTIPITGLLLNLATYTCPSCTAAHHIFGPPQRFRDTAAHLGIDVLGEMPVVGGLSESGDKGVPFPLFVKGKATVEEVEATGGEKWLEEMDRVVEHVVESLGFNPT